MTSNNEFTELMAEVINVFVSPQANVKRQLIHRNWPELYSALDRLVWDEGDDGVSRARVERLLGILNNEKPRTVETIDESLDRWVEVTGTGATDYTE